MKEDNPGSNVKFLYKMHNCFIKEIQTANLKATVFIKLRSVSIKIYLEIKLDFHERCNQKFLHPLF